MTNALSILSDYNANDDFADMRAKDHILPRATLLQPLSVLVMDGNGVAGTIIDSATHSVLVPAREDGKYIIPVMHWLEWLEWNRDRDCPKNEKVIARSVDPAGDLAKRADKWEVFIDDKGRERPVVTEYHNYIVAIVDDKISDYESLYILPFCRSSHKTGKMLLNRLYKTKIASPDGFPVRAPMFYNRIAIKTSVETKGADKYWVPILGDARPTPPEHFAQLVAIATDLKARKRDIIDRNRSDVAENEGASGETSAAPASEM